jgi:hypothetical protein
VNTRVHLLIDGNELRLELPEESYLAPVTFWNMLLSSVPALLPDAAGLNKAHLILLLCSSNRVGFQNAPLELRTGCRTGS